MVNFFCFEEIMLYWPTCWRPVKYV